MWCAPLHSPPRAHVSSATISITACTQITLGRRRVHFRFHGRMSCDCLRARLCVSSSPPSAPRISVSMVKQPHREPPDDTVLIRLHLLSPCPPAIKGFLYFSIVNLRAIVDATHIAFPFLPITLRFPSTAVQRQQLCWSTNGR